MGMMFCQIVIFFLYYLLYQLSFFLDQNSLQYTILNSVFLHANKKGISVFGPLPLKVLCYLQSEKICVTVLQNLQILQKTTTCIGLQADQILSVNIQYIYIFNFGRGFRGSFSVLFPKAPASCGKKVCLRFFNLISNRRYQFFCPWWCLLQQIFSTKQLLF